ncbi:hypothetical protein BXZ70DRAFT_1000738 [Cristinia sonorae]|uniref:Uncharacterized protein n=1 Tax=Cristinia sonorae TaxID=1940300 RepID=A0A8K0UL24_9AGAR|nr:hypothetical protein BXZ70DRAFT_1000738 [Cristinia sonorae]
MCQNVIDGRYHTTCGHFIAMSTRLQDCLRPNCLFSSRHCHAAGCKSSQCVRLMVAPQRNPIRISETRCADCVMRGAEGMIGV